MYFYDGSCSEIATVDDDLPRAVDTPAPFRRGRNFCPVHKDINCALGVRELGTIRASDDPKAKRGRVDLVDHRGGEVVSHGGRSEASYPDVFIMVAVSTMHLE